MKLRLASPAVLVDINKIDGLGYIKEDDGWLKIGAMTRESELDASDLVREKYPLLADPDGPLVSAIAGLATALQQELDQH